jgi:ABC-type transport system involved in multi-copper enzyme maturation permease subunit
MSGVTRWRIGLGPVFAYERITASRRWQGYALRSCFVAALLCALYVVRVSPRAPATTTLRGLAQMAEFFFLAVSGTQLALVLLVAPAATAGAICFDRARGTLSHMLMTDLSDGEIVLGKLAARLVPVLSLLACVLPVMELLALLGGVDPAALLGGFAVSVGVAVLGCSLAMFFSLWVGKTHEALMGTYSVWSLWLLAGPIFDLVTSRIGPVWGKPLRTMDPFFLALAPYWWPKSVTSSDYLWFLGATVSLSMVLAGGTVVWLRWACLREKVAKKPRPGATNQIMGLWRTFYEKVPLVRPSLDGNPVLWREWHRSRPSRFSVIVAAVFAGMSLLCSMMVIIWPGGASCAWVNALQVSIGFLLLSVAAATSLAEERARGSLDLLLSTPLSNREIVLGKWLGAYRIVPLLAIMPALLIGRGAFFNDWTLCWVTLLMIAFVLSAGAAITSLGIAMAISFSRLGRAVAMTVTLYLLVAAGWFLLVSMAVSNGPRGDRGLLMGSPFFWAGEMAYEVTNRPGDVPIGWAILWTFFWAFVAVSLLRASLAQFERRLGRFEKPVALSARSAWRFQVSTKIYLAVTVALGLVALNQTWASTAVALQFALGLLLLARRAALSSALNQKNAGAGEPELSENRVWPVVRAWLGAFERVFVLVIVPVVIVLLIDAPERIIGLQLVVIGLYAFSIGAAFFCLGVAIAKWRRGRGGATTSVIVAWAVINGGLLALSVALGGDSQWAGLAVGMGSPFLGGNLLASGMIHSPLRFETAVAWALVWSVLYALAPVWLLRRAWRKSKPESVDLISRASLPHLMTPNSQ